MKRIYSFDYFKLFAILGVIVIHTGGLFGVVIGGVDLTPVASVIDAIVRFAVPFFLITAGFMFFIKADEKGLKKQYLNYVKKLAILYVVWSVVYFFSNSYGAINWYGRTFEEYFWETIFVSDILYYGKKISEPLWFMPALIFSISLVALAKRFNFLKILTIVALVLNIVGLFGEPQMYNFIVDFPLFTRDTLFFALFYTSLGAFLAEKERYKNITKSNKFWFIMSALFMVLIIAEKMILGTLNNWLLPAGDFYLFTIPFTFSLFMACVKSPDLGKGSIITKFGQGALGIYLIHSLIQGWTWLFYYPLLGDQFWTKTPFRLTQGIVMFVLSWIIYYTIPGLIKKLFKPKNKSLNEEKISA